MRARKSTGPKVPAKANALAPPNKHRLNDRCIGDLQPKDGGYLVWESCNMGWRSRYSPLVINPSSASTAAVVDPVGFILPTPPRSKWSMLASWSQDHGAGCRWQRRCRRPPSISSRRYLRGLAARHLKYAKGKNKSWQQADKLVKRYLLQRWGKLQAASITRSDVKAMRSRIDAPILANQNLAAASTIFSWALKEDLPGSRSTPASVSSVTRPPVAREYYQIASCQDSGRRSMTPV